MTLEVWKPIVGFEGLYQVSNLGRAMRVARIGVRNGAPCRFQQQIVAGCRSGQLGYMQLHLYVNGKRYLKYLHASVLEAFVGPRPTPRHQVCHWNANIKDNRLSNLRWGTRADNAVDTIRHGSQRGVKNPLAKLTDDDVREIRRRRASGEMARFIAADFHISHDHIYGIANRKVWGHVE